MDIAYQNLPDKLKPFVSAVWASRGEETVRNERIVPDGGSCLIFNFGGAVTAERADGSVTTWKNHFFAGLATSYIDLTYQGSFEQVGIIFKPFGAFHLMNIPMSEFSDAGYEVDLFGKHQFQQVSHEMANADCLYQRLNLICRWLEHAYSDATIESFVPAVTSLLLHQDEISVNEIADEMGRSQQHIARLFNKYVGASPKKLQRIFRFQKVLRTLSARPKDLLTATAYELNYFDQPHFNNEVRSFSGFTPAQLAKQNVLGSFRVIR